MGLLFLKDNVYANLSKKIGGCKGGERGSL